VCVPNQPLDLGLSGCRSPAVAVTERWQTHWGNREARIPGTSWTFPGLGFLSPQKAALALDSPLRVD
jgi:hypothetical protein